MELYFHSIIFPKAQHLVAVQFELTYKYELYTYKHFQKKIPYLTGLPSLAQSSTTDWKKIAAAALKELSIPRAFDGLIFRIPGSISSSESPKKRNTLYHAFFLAMLEIGSYI